MAAKEELDTLGVVDEDTVEYFLEDPGLSGEFAYEVMTRSNGNIITVKNVHINGVKRTNNALLTDAVKDVFGVMTLGQLRGIANAAKAKLALLGVFSEVELVLDRDETDPTAIQVEFYVVEKGLLQTEAKATAGKTQGQAEFSLSLTNLSGNADNFDLKYTRSSSQGNSVEASYTYPVEGSVHFPLTFGAYQANDDLPGSKHSQVARGIFASYDTHSSVGQHNLRYELGWHTLKLGESPSFALRREAGHSMKSSLRHTAMIDLMNDDMTRGAVLKTTNELAGFGGGSCFLKNTLELAHRLTSHGFELQTTLRAGLIHSLVPGFASRAAGYLLSPSSTAPAPDGPVHDMNKVRILDRFFLGGGSDLRGFLLRSVGPTAGADAMGGNTYWASCLQLHTPLPYRPWREKFGASLRPNIFINAGSCFNRATTASGAASIANALLRPDAVSWGVGLTFRAGRTQLELNYCFPLLTRGAEANSGLQFAIGLSLF